MTMKTEIAALKARVAELEAAQPAARKPYAKTVTQELPLDSRGMGPSYAEFGQDAMRAKADAEQAAFLERVRLNEEDAERRRSAKPSPRDAADRALAEDWSRVKELPLGAPGED